MIKFFRSWCEELIISSFIVTILEMLVPTGNIKKYIRVITGVYMIFVILNPILLRLNRFDLENQLNCILETSSSEFDEEMELKESIEILNTISKNLEVKEENNVREIQE